MAALLCCSAECLDPCHAVQDVVGPEDIAFGQRVAVSCKDLFPRLSDV